MHRYNSDYMEGAHPEILKILTETNMQQTVGYGEDEYCQRAKALIKNECKRQDADVYFLSGGTQTNLTFIASALKSYQGVISAKSGHINVHETGAIEATGHKVIAVDSSNGKISSSQIKAIYEEDKNNPDREHTVQPKMVYISQSTETGSIYKLAEIKQISDVCRECGYYLYLDGARLGYAVMSVDNDVLISDIASLCDAFYIGGTKVGALFGEALVISNDELKADFKYYIKQRGAMFAKGRLLGLQFIALFTDGLYYKISKNAVNQAMKIKEAFKEKNIRLLEEAKSNQLFVLFTDEQAKIFMSCASFWEKYSASQTVMRFCTSWATSDEDTDELIKLINTL